MKKVKTYFLLLLRWPYVSQFQNSKTCQHQIRYHLFCDFFFIFYRITTGTCSWINNEQGLNINWYTSERSQVLYGSPWTLLIILKVVGYNLFPDCDSRLVNMLMFPNMDWISVKWCWIKHALVGFLVNNSKKICTIILFK